MKANEAPEKIYINGFSAFATVPVKEGVEYIRTDAFIEKAREFLKSYRQDTPDGTGYIAGIINDETIDDFVNYMKGE